MSDSRIILIETSTALCSTALLEGGVITARRFANEPRAHAGMTAPFVQQMLDERRLKVSDCDAVCLSMGPGSYTGLRVGSSTAKGLCFGAGIPLLAVGTLDVLAAQAIEEGLPEECEYIVPMIDARRMEVYTAVYSVAGERLTEVRPVVVENLESLGLPSPLRGEIPLTPEKQGKGSSGDIPSPATTANQSNRAPLRIGSPLTPEKEGKGRSEGPASSATTANGILFIGDGVQKCEGVLAGEGRWLRQECPRADAMKAPALRELAAGAFRDTAYFEPFYLKDFVATVGKRLF